MYYSYYIHEDAIGLGMKPFSFENSLLIFIFGFIELCMNRLKIIGI